MTLTESRSLISDDMIEALQRLFESYDVVIISGAQRSRMLKQIPWIADWPCTVMAQSGNDTRIGENVLFQNNLTFDDVHKILDHIERVSRETSNDDRLHNDRIELRGGQVSHSMIGHNAQLELKKQFDPTGKKRRSLLEKVPFTHDDLMVRIGGTTNFDYSKDGWGKRGNIERLITMNDWDKDLSLYVGDQLFEGGNDFDMIGYMETQQVSGPAETLEIIAKLQ